MLVPTAAGGSLRRRTEAGIAHVSTVMGTAAIPVARHVPLGVGVVAAGATPRGACGCQGPAWRCTATPFRNAADARPHQPRAKLVAQGQWNRRAEGAAARPPAPRQSTVPVPTRRRRLPVRRHVRHRCCFCCAPAGAAVVCCAPSPRPCVNAVLRQGPGGGSAAVRIDSFGDLASLHRWHQRQTGCLAVWWTILSHVATVATRQLPWCAGALRATHERTATYASAAGEVVRWRRPAVPAWTVTPGGLVARTCHTPADPHTLQHASRPG